MPLNHPHLNSSEKLSSWGHILDGVRGENLSGFHLENTSGFCRELWSPSMDSNSPSQTPVSSCKRLSNKLITVKLLGGALTHWCVCKGQTSTSGVFYCLHLVSETVSHWPGASQVSEGDCTQPPRIRLSRPFSTSAQRIQTCPAMLSFNGGAGDPNSGLHASVH